MIEMYEVINYEVVRKNAQPVILSKPSLIFTPFSPHFSLRLSFPEKS
jgi:hypothetical protein